MLKFFLLLIGSLLSFPVYGFCGFYVSRATSELYNKSSKVAIVRDGIRTVLTMSNDYKGDPKEFAIVIPVPQILKKEQIHVNRQSIMEHLDAYTAPRLVEYYDRDPCIVMRYRENGAVVDMLIEKKESVADKAKSFGVVIEASYTVGEYDIMILSSEKSSGLIRFLISQGYTLPKGAERIVNSYIKQGLYFFVAKVNLKEKAKLGFTYLRPLSIAYESRRFMLPIRLGTVNAHEDQELFIFILTRTGRVETVNYRTVYVPTDIELPPATKEDFANVYKTIFNNQWKKEGKKVVFLEYAWDMGWCDPCAADPLTREELREIGVFWLDDYRFLEKRRVPRPGVNVYVTRLHVRYNKDLFPDDIMFISTGNKNNYQVRYILRHPFVGNITCPEGEKYLRELKKRRYQELVDLARLTGWSIDYIRKRYGLDNYPVSDPDIPWWKKIWPKK